MGLECATDIDVWSYARRDGFTIVTKDSNFNDLIVLRGYPPKIVWLRLGNCTTRQIESTLRNSQQVILEFLRSSDTGILELA